MFLKVVVYVVNQNGEFPMDQRVSIRLHISEKKQAQDLPFTYREIFMYGLRALSNEETMLKFSIGAIEERLADKESDVHSLRALLAAKKNRLRMIAPHELDESTLKSMLLDSAREYAESIFNRHGDDSLRHLESHVAKSSIRSEGRDLGYDGEKFLIEVKNLLEELCIVGDDEMCDSDV